MNNLIFNPEKVYSFLLSKTDKNNALEVLLEFYYAFSIFNPLSLEDKQYRFRERYKYEFIDVLEKKGWSAIPCPQQSVLPLENNSLTTTLSYGSIKTFKLLYQYFESENIDIIKEISKNVNNKNGLHGLYQKKNFARDHQAFFRAVKYFNYNLKEREEMVTKILQVCLSIPTKEFKEDILSSLLSAYNQGYNQEKLATLLANFIKVHKTCNAKANTIFEQLRTLIPENTLKNNLTEREYNSLQETEDDGYIEKNMDATQIRLNLSKIRERNKISTIVMTRNLSELSRRITALVSDLDDYIDCTITTKNEIKIEICYEKNGSGNTLSVTKALVNYCLGLKEKQGTYHNSKKFMEDLLNVKNTSLLHNKLSVNLSSNTNEVKRPKL